MTTVPLEYGERARSYRWRQFIVTHPDRDLFVLLDLHARLRIRVKEWKMPLMRLVEEARLSRGAV